MSSRQWVRPAQDSTSHALVGNATAPAGPRAGDTIPHLDAVQRLNLLVHANGDVRLSPLQRRVLTELVGAYNYELGCAWPSQETIASALKSLRNGVVVESTGERVNLALAALERYGYVLAEPWAYKAHGQVRVGRRYRLVYPPRTPLELVRAPEVSEPAPQVAPEVSEPAPRVAARVSEPAPRVAPGVSEPAGPGVSEPAPRTGEPGTGTPEGRSGDQERRPGVGCMHAGGDVSASIDDGWWPTAEQWAEARATHRLGEAELRAIHAEFQDYCRRRPQPYVRLGQAWFRNLDREMRRRLAYAPTSGDPSTTAPRKRPGNLGPSERKPSSAFGRPMGPPPSERMQHP